MTTPLERALGALPEHLEERTRAVGATRAEPRYVLYWMRTAVRAHENPALDVAATLARTLGVELFVYHALSERYPYASDRHHTSPLRHVFHQRTIEEPFARPSTPTGIRIAETP